MPHADNPLENEGSDLVALADSDNKITAFHTTNPHFSTGDVQQLLTGSLNRAATSDWWYNGGTLYQVVLQPVHRYKAPDDPQSRPGFVGPHHEILDDPQTGTVIVGRELGYTAVHDMGRMSSSNLAFSYGTDVVASTLSSLDERELGQQTQSLTTQSPATQGQIRIQNEPYFAISVALNDAPAPAVPSNCFEILSRRGGILERNESSADRIGNAGAPTMGTWLAVFISGDFHATAMPDLDKVEFSRAKRGFQFSTPGAR